VPPGLGLRGGASRAGEDDHGQFAAGPAQLAKLLAQPSRFQAVLLLARHGEMSVTDLCRRLGRQQSALSQHLGLLRNAGLVRSDRRGKSRFYRVELSRIGEAIRQFYGHAEEIGLGAYALTLKRT
jgi:ArsR family transcriptional regulator